MDYLADAVRNHKRVHFIGIGGIMMFCLAQEMQRRGARVTGNDRDASEKTRILEAAGIPVTIGHGEEHVHGADVIVRTAAILDSFPEIVYAKAQGIPLLERPQVLNYIMQDYRHTIAVSGTHGKSTTSGMLTHALLRLEKDPTAFLGATLPEIGGAVRLGGETWFVAEACEYYRSFLHMVPEVAVIMNAEPEHLDYFRDTEDVIDAFRAFALNVPKNGMILYNADNDNTLRALYNIDRPMCSFGIERGTLRAIHIRNLDRYATFTFAENGVPICDIEMRVPGKHNVYNALATASVLHHYGVEGKEIARAISSFRGIKRRFEYRGEINGVDVVEDYAHHPDELRTTLTTAKAMGYNRVLGMFQSHMYSRTSKLFDGFAETLSMLDVGVIIDIFPGREENTIGFDVRTLADAAGIAYRATPEEAARYLRAEMRPGDLVMVLGAGDINRATKVILEPETP